MRRFLRFFSQIDETMFRQVLAVLLAVVTALTAVVAFLQSDAAARDDRADRDCKRYALEAMGHKVSGSARTHYDYGTAYRSWAELDLLASAAAGREDVLAGERYAEVRDGLVPLSPLLSAPYLDGSSGTVDLARYEANTYLVEVTVLEEKFSAAAAVKEAWDAKADTYIVHLTLLALSLFLLGLAATISGPPTRWLFAGLGVAMAVATVAWAASVLVRPVPDLREQRGAIDAYASGVGLAYQGRYAEAVRSFDTALQVAPDYAGALAARAEAQLALGNLAAAAADLERARAGGEGSASVAGRLSRTYYLLGRFDEAVEMNRTALAASPDELYIRFDLGLALLVSGQVDAGRAEYAAAMAQAAQQVAAAKAAGQQPPTQVWWTLDDGAAGDLDDLLRTLESGAGRPPRERIAYPEVVKEAAEELQAQLKSLAVALEYSGQPPQGSLAAEIGPFLFGRPVYDEAAGLVDVQQTDTFTAGTQVAAMQFAYAGMHDGQEVVLKVYVDGHEDPSWRQVYSWDLGPAGTARWLLTPASGDDALAPGRYGVEMYVDYHLARRGSFVVEKQ